VTRPHPEAIQNSPALSLAYKGHSHSGDSGVSGAVSQKPGTESNIYLLYYNIKFYWNTAILIPL
jgi:hypothetical protein